MCGRIIITSAQGVIHILSGITLIGKTFTSTKKKKEKGFEILLSHPHHPYHHLSPD